MKAIPTLLGLVFAASLPLAATAADPATEAPAATGTPTTQPPMVEPGTTEVPPMFKELDKDKDGQLSKDEGKRSAEVQANFDAIDTDANGRVSIIEWSAFETEKETKGK